MPLACGNTVVLKASEICPAVHHLIGDVFQRAGCGSGVVNVISNAPAEAAAIVDALISHPKVKRINFTGSTRVGRLIAEKAGRLLKPVLLELGGKAPMVVLDDADIDSSVDAAVFGAFMHQGQICMSTERIVVDQSIADMFVPRFAARASALSVGDPLKSNATLGAMVDVAAAERITALIDDARSKGAEIVAGGEREGALMAATVIDRVTPENANLSRGKLRTGHHDRAGARCRRGDRDSQRHGVRSVGGGIRKGHHAGDGGRWLHRERHLSYQWADGGGRTSNAVWGTKSSGYGRFGGLAGIAEFTELRWLTIQKEKRQYPF